MERSDLSADQWFDEDGGSTEALFVGWIRSLNTQRSGDPVVVERLVAAILGRVEGASQHNCVRSIDPCPICGAVVYLSRNGHFASGISDEECRRAREQVIAEGPGWDVLGHSELWLSRPRGGHFVSPTLVVHFVHAHGYGAPSVFVARLLAAANEPS